MGVSGTRVHAVTLLIASLAVALVLYLYDTLVAGPAFARPLLAAVLGGAAVWGLNVDAGESALAVLSVAAAAGGIAAVALVQYLEVQRDAAMTQVLRRR